MLRRVQWLVLLATLAIPFSGWSCEPILPLAQLLGGASLAGPLLLTQSFICLGIAVAIKCGAFIIFERRLTCLQAALYMLLANVLSTIPGGLVAVLTSASSGGIIFALPLVFLMGAMVGRRFSNVKLPGRKALSGGTAAVAFIAFYLGSILLFVLADIALDTRSFASYWILKFIFVTIAATTGMLISSVLEECVIAFLAPRTQERPSYFKSVLRANYITLAVVLLVAALEILPKRLRSPHFITAFINLF